jgi:fatty-acyl-CoA synthase
MRGLMQDRPLVLTQFFDRAERLFPEKQVVTSTARGIERETYGEWAARTRRLGGVLDDLGVSPDGRVGSFAWNTARHLELYFGVPCTGRVLHTLNIRLYGDQITYIVNHAEDEVIFVDRSVLAQLWDIVDTFTTVRHIVVMDDGRGELPDDTKGVTIHDYEDLLAAASPVEFRADDEWAAATMCYTSGTTGNPKGVVYSHRSTWLHTAGIMMADSFGIAEPDVVMPVVPMFHANGWGLSHAGVATGATLVMPGPDLSARALADLIEAERVTVTAGVPTIWMGVLDELDTHDVSSLRLIANGGAALPSALSEAYRAKIGMPIRACWGMTETGPIAAACRIKSSDQDLSEDEKIDLRTSIGVMLPGVDYRIVDEATGELVPWDGQTRGELQCAGPWIASSYYDDPRSPDSFTDDGWLKTGDVATCDPKGYVRIVDRTKDVVKSGGEWISSVELENEIMAHPAVAEAAVIGVKHPKWTERPLACVVIKPGESVSREEILTFLDGRIAKWWLPDDVVFIDEVPKTSVGKFAKRVLRDQFAEYELPTA